jgi:polyisoprenoid-binding protein YceI
MITPTQLLRFILSLLLFSLGIPDGNGRADPPPEQLLVFVQPDASSVNRRFQQTILPRVREVAEEMGVFLAVLDSANGFPKEVAVTPLIVYQNHRGRSIYQGRTTTLDRIRNFIRTSRFVPQGEADLVRKDIPVWEYGRSRIWAPIKVSPVTGAPPEDYDNAEFQREARRAIEMGFSKFRTRKEAKLGRADRGFYMDFYPWRSEDGALFLSLALYSMFDCKEPVYKTGDAPLVGPWKDRKQLFRRAAARMEEMVQKQVADPESGDGIDPVADTVPAATWAGLGYPLPPAPAKADMKIPVDAEVPRHWVLEASDSEKTASESPPMVQFRFAPPLDHYRGEVTRGSGELEFPDHLLPEGMVGHVEMDPTTVTMGVPDLDKALQGSVFLHTKKHPVSRFVIRSAGGDGQPIAYGRLSPASVTGDFTLRGVTLPLTATAEMEPIINQEGEPRLLVRAGFQITVTDFGVEGADGPSPANETMLFDTVLSFLPEQD